VKNSNHRIWKFKDFVSTVNSLDLDSIFLFSILSLISLTVMKRKDCFGILCPVPREIVVRGRNSRWRYWVDGYLQFMSSVIMAVIYVDYGLAIWHWLMVVTMLVSLTLWLPWSVRSEGSLRTHNQWRNFWLTNLSRVTAVFICTSQGFYLFSTAILLSIFKIFPVYGVSVRCLHLHSRI